MSSSSFVPRRSPRLAANAANAAKNSLLTSLNTNIRTMELRICKTCSFIDCKFHPFHYTKEESRILFLDQKGKTVSDDYKNECVLKIRQYLNDLGSAKGQTAKTVIATCLIMYLIDNPRLIATYERFRNTIIGKMHEFRNEKEIPDKQIHNDFKNVIESILYVIV